MKQVADSFQNTMFLWWSNIFILSKQRLLFISRAIFESQNFSFLPIHKLTTNWLEIDGSRSVESSTLTATTYSVDRKSVSPNSNPSAAVWLLDPYSAPGFDVCCAHVVYFYQEGNKKSKLE